MLIAPITLAIHRLSDASRHKQLKMICAIAIDTHHLQALNYRFAFADYIRAMKQQCNLSTKTIQNYCTAARRLQAKYVSAGKNYSVSDEGVEALANWVADALSDTTYALTTTDISAWLAGKESEAEKALAVAEREAQNTRLAMAAFFRLQNQN